MTGKNIGDLLNYRQGHLGLVPGRLRADRQRRTASRSAAAKHENIGKIEVQDYVPHHDPFQYYKSTSNPKHLTPTSEAEIGKTDRANHNYDISDFFLTLKHGNLPSVSFLKPPAYEDAHAGLLRPARRAAVAGHHDRPDREVTGLVLDRHRRHLRRLRRLVRPPGVADPERLK